MVFLVDNAFIFLFVAVMWRRKLFLSKGASYNKCVKYWFLYFQLYTYTKQKRTLILNNLNLEKSKLQINVEINKQFRIAFKKKHTQRIIYHLLLSFSRSSFYVCNGIPAFLNRFFCKISVYEKNCILDEPHVSVRGPIYGV